MPLVRVTPQDSLWFGVPPSGGLVLALVLVLPLKHEEKRRPPEGGTPNQRGSICGHVEQHELGVVLALEHELVLGFDAGPVAGLERDVVHQEPPARHVEPG